MPFSKHEVSLYQKELRSFLLSNASVQESLTRTARMIQAAVHVTGVYFVFLDANNEFRVIPGFGISPEDTNSAFLDDEIVFSDSSLIVQDTTRDYRFANDNWVRQLGIRMYVSVPLRTGGNDHIGLLCLTNRRRQDFSVEDLGVLIDFASAAMEHIELQFDLFKGQELPPQASQVHQEGDDTSPSHIEDTSDVIPDDEILSKVFESNLMNALPLPAIAISEKGEITFWNQSCIDLFGYAKEERTNLNISELLQEEEQGKEMQRLIKRVFNRRRISGKTLVFNSKKGEAIVTKGRFYPVYNDDKVESCLLVLTITNASGTDINPWFVASAEKSIFTTRCSPLTFRLKLYSNETISIESCSREFSSLTGHSSGITRIPLEEWVHSEDLFKWLPRFSDMQAGLIDMLSYRILIENERTAQVRDTVAVTEVDLEEGSLILTGVLEFQATHEELKNLSEIEIEPAEEEAENPDEAPVDELDEIVQ